MFLLTSDKDFFVGRGWEDRETLAPQGEKNSTTIPYCGGNSMKQAEFMAHMVSSSDLWNRRICGLLWSLSAISNMVSHQLSSGVVIEFFEKLCGSPLARSVVTTTSRFSLVLRKKEARWTLGKFSRKSMNLKSSTPKGRLAFGGIFFIRFPGPGNFLLVRSWGCFFFQIKPLGKFMVHASMRSNRWWKQQGGFGVRQRFFELWKHSGIN